MSPPLQARQRVKGVIMNMTLTKRLMWLVIMMNTKRVNGFSVFIREFISAFWSKKLTEFKYLLVAHTTWVVSNLFSKYLASNCNSYQLQC